MVRVVVMLAALLLAVAGWTPAGTADSLRNEDAAPGASHAHGAPRKPAKPKPPKLDKEKNCQWGHDIDIEVDLARLRISQFELRAIIGGAGNEINGYRLYADPQRMVLYIRSPDGGWFVSDLMRLGSPDEGCIFYYADAATPLEGEPPL